MKTAILSIVTGFALFMLVNLTLLGQDYGITLCTGVLVGFVMPIICHSFFNDKKIQALILMYSPTLLLFFINFDYSTLPIFVLPKIVGTVAGLVFIGQNTKIKYLNLGFIAIVCVLMYELGVPNWHWSQSEITKNINKPVFIHSLTTLNNENVTKHALDKKVIFLEFWGFNCVYCLKKMPTQMQLEAKFKNNPNVLLASVNINSDSTTKIKNFFQNKGYNTNILLDYKGQFFKTLNIQGVPAGILIDKKGNLRRIYSGWSKDLDRGMVSYVGNDIEELLNEP